MANGEWGKPGLGYDTDKYGSWTYAQPNIAEQGADTPKTPEQKEIRESALQRIGRIINEKAQEIYKKITRQDERRKEWLNRLENDPDQKRLDFINRNLDTTSICPSTGQKLSVADARKLYDYYSEHIAEVDEKEQPKTRYGTLLEIDEMLKERIGDTGAADGTEARADTARLLGEVCDLEETAFVEKYFNTTVPCPSTGEKVSEEEARQLFRDYREYAARNGHDRRKHTKYAVFVEIDSMLEERIKNAEAAGDAETKADSERLLKEVLDLEARAAIPQYLGDAKDLQAYGDKESFKKYITNEVWSKGYEGSLNVERTLGVLEELNENWPIEEVWRSVTQDGREGGVNWQAVSMYSERGHELQNFDKGMRANISDEAREKILSRSKEEFMKDILQREGVGSNIPDDVAENMYRLFRNDPDFNAVSFDNPASLEARASAFASMAKSADARIKELEAMITNIKDEQELYGRNQSGSDIIYEVTMKKDGSYGGKIRSKSDIVKEVVEEINGPVTMEEIIKIVRSVIEREMKASTADYEAEISQLKKIRWCAFDAGKVINHYLNPDSLKSAA